METYRDETAYPNFTDGGKTGPWERRRVARTPGRPQEQGSGFPSLQELNIPVYVLVGGGCISPLSSLWSSRNRYVVP